MGKGQYIFGRASPISISDKGKEMLKSSGTVVSDFIEHDFTSARDGILCSFESIPIAFYDISTLNGMVFSRALWEGLLKNQYFMRTIEDGSHFGEASHADRDEVLLKEVACRVNKLWFGSNNLVLGNVDILDTPNGRIIHSLAKISRVGISSRGFGELVPRHDGLKDVDPDSYSHICFDMVAFPAVPDASMTLITGDNALPNTEMMNMSATLRDTSYNDPSLFNSLKNTLIAQEVRRKLSYKSLFSVGKSRIVSARATVLSLLNIVDSSLRKRFKGLVFSRQEAVAFISDSGVVEKIEISFSIHGEGIVPYQDVMVIGNGG